MRVKTSSPAKVSRPAAKPRPTRDKGVISLKGPGGLPRTAKRPAPIPVASPSASDLKTMRLEQIKQRARAKRPAVAAPVVEAPEVVMVAPAIEAEVSPVVEAPAVMTDEQLITPAVTSLAAPLDRRTSATAHHRSWSPPRARRRTSTPVTLAVRLISKLLRWGGVLGR